MEGVFAMCLYICAGLEHLQLETHTVCSFYFFYAKEEFQSCFVFVKLKRWIFFNSPIFAWRCLTSDHPITTQGTGAVI